MLIAAPGRGKSTLSTNLSRAFQPWLGQVSGGKLMRERGRSLGFGDDITAFAKYMREHPEEGHDEWCDSRMRTYTRQNNLVVDAHLPCFFPYGFIVKLVCSAFECARRQARNAEELRGILAAIVSRHEDDDSKYAKMYPGSIWLDTDYDLVLNTETYNEEQCFRIVMAEHAAWAERNRHHIVGEDKIPDTVLLAS